MKFANKEIVSRETAIRKALYLRYGDEQPVKDPKPCPLLTFAQVAKLMQVGMRFVQALCRSYFSKKKDLRFSLQPPKLGVMSRGSKATLETLTAEEVEFMTDRENLRQWAAYSLSWRCVLFHRKFPDRWLNKSTLAKLYSQCGIKRKVISINRAPSRMTARLEEFENKILKLHEEVSKVISSREHLVFVDESIFTARGYNNMRVWSHTRENLVIEDRTGQQPC